MVVIGVFVAIFASGVAMARMGYDHADLDGLFLLFAALWSAGHAGEAFGARWMPDLCKLFAVYLGLALAAPLATAVLVTCEFPMVDAKLAAADRLLFPAFSWPSLARWFGSHDAVSRVLSHVYSTLGWQPLLLFAVLTLSGRAQMAWRVMTAWSAALLICVITFTFTPALDAYTYFAIGHREMPGILSDTSWNAPRILTGIRNGTIDTLGNSTMEGLISMPSFHAAGAVILAWGYGKVAWLRWPFLVLNLIMLVSAVPVGGHYLIDILAGLLVAVIAISVAERDQLSWFQSLRRNATAAFAGSDARH